MELQKRFETLQPRERRLVLLLGGVFAVVFGLLLPIGVSTSLAAERSKHEELTNLVQRLFAEREQILQLQAKNKLVLDRYRTPAPALAGFLDNSAKALELEIPEFKDRSPVPIGKDYEERATDISMKKVNMRKLVLFMEKIAQANFPVSIGKFTLRKRATEDDSWDVNMTVSAYHRTAAIKPAGKTDTKAEGNKEEKEETP